MILHAAVVKYTRYVLYETLLYDIKSNICLQRGLNSRPLVYKTSALPLSYRGCLCRVSNLYHVLDDGQGTPQHMLAIAALILKLKVLVQRWTQPSIVNRRG